MVSILVLLDDFRSKSVVFTTDDRQPSPVSILVLLDDSLEGLLYLCNGPVTGVSILVLLDDFRSKTPNPTNITGDNMVSILVLLDDFRSKTCQGRDGRAEGLVSILVLLDDSLEGDDVIHCPNWGVSILVLLDVFARSLRSVHSDICTASCFNPCSLG